MPRRAIQRERAGSGAAVDAEVGMWGRRTPCPCWSSDGRPVWP